MTRCSIPPEDRTWFGPGRPPNRPDHRGTPSGPDRTLWWQWFRTVTAAEAAGFVTPAVVGALLASASGQVMAFTLVVAGAVEGALWGAGQARVLRSRLPRPPVVRFVVATALAAALAYAVAMVPVLLGNRLTVLPPVAKAGGGLVLGIALPATIGIRAVDGAADAGAACRVVDPGHALT